MDVLYDIPPFNMASGPAFLVFYFILASLGLLAAVGAQIVLGAHLNRGGAPDASLETSPPTIHGSPYRADDERSSSRRCLTIGRLPQAAEHVAIAYLKAGTRGVANMLISTAFAAGWLSAEAEQADHVVLGANQAPIEPAHVMLYERLRAFGSSKIAVEQVHGAATAVAESVEMDIVRELEAVGLLRSEQTVRRLRAIVWAAGSLLLTIGAIRTLRGISLNRPVALLVTEMIGVTVVCALLAARSLRDSSLKAEYLGWLHDATASLRSDVYAGRRRDLTSVGLTIATTGGAALAVPELAALTSILIPAPIVTGSDESSSSSSGCSSPSCSSSSCSGGSSCGG